MVPVVIKVSSPVPPVSPSFPTVSTFRQPFIIVQVSVFACDLSVRCRPTLPLVLSGKGLIAREDPRVASHATRAASHATRSTFYACRRPKT